MILARDPLCRMRTTMLAMIEGAIAIGDWKLRVALAERLALFCDGTRPSTDADHIVPKPFGDDNESNLHGACHQCHSHKTLSLDNILTADGRGVEILQLLSRADRRRETRDTPAK